MQPKIEPQLLLEDWAEKSAAERKLSLAEKTQNFQGNGRLLTKEIILERIDRDPITECWIWKLHKNRQGYGVARERGRNVFVHRRAYELWNEPLPKGFFALHNCPSGDNPSCCNPDHLWKGTKGDNNRDAVKKGRQVIVNRKLSDEQVRSIRSDGRTQQVIAAEYHIGQNTVSSIKRRSLYKHA